jgi:hypothetical protein
MGELTASSQMTDRITEARALAGKARAKASAAPDPQVASIYLKIAEAWTQIADSMEFMAEVNSHQIVVPASPKVHLH